MALRTPHFLKANPQPFDHLRLLLEAAMLQEGVLKSTHYKVTAAAAGGLRVDVAAGFALVKGDTGTPSVGYSQGLYPIINDASVANAVTFATADATNPRVDQVYLAVNDSTDLGSGSNGAVFGIAQGAPTSGATLDNRSGAVALPSNAIRLADVLIPAAGAAVIAGNVRDRRPWAKGAYTVVTNSTDQTFGTTDAALASLSARVECTGNPVRVTVSASVYVDTAGARTVLSPWMDGARFAGFSGGLYHAAVTTVVRHVVTYDGTPAAGSHLFAAGAAVTAGGASTSGSITPTLLVVEELLPAANNT